MTTIAELDFRAEDRGGDVDPVKALLGALSVAGHSELILLIHGYETTKPEALERYVAFSGAQAKLVGEGRDWAFGVPVVEVFWPGDARWGFLRPLYYPWAIPVADRVGGLLAQVLRVLAQQSGGRLTLHVAAHSLGNRLLLSTLSEIADQSGIAIGRILHMAAAVPTWRIETANDCLRNGLLRECGGTSALSVHSSRDAVLHYVFPVGETFNLQEDGVFPVALGHRHWTGADGLPASFEQLAQDDLGHGDYWFKINPVTVHSALGLSQATVRLASLRETAIGPQLDQRSGESRPTPSRSTGGSLTESLYPVS